MKATYEIYMASISWASPHIVSNWYLARVPLEPVNDNVYETVTYTQQYTQQGKEYCQIVIKSTETVTQSKSGESLYRIPGSDIWLIKQEWKLTRKKDVGYHYCPSINSEGSIFLNVGDKSVIINITSNISDFDFERLKEDFSGELWHLLTSSNSNIYSERKVGLSVLSASDLIKNYAEIFLHILKNPKKELKQIVSFLPLNKVKPVIATYRKLAINGLNTNVRLPSKITQEHFDLYENRYLCQMLYEIQQIVDYTVKYTDLHLKNLQTYIISAEQALDNLNKPEVLNEIEILDEVESQRNKLNILNQKWLDISIEVCNSLQRQQKNYEVNIFKSVYNEDFTFWCKFKGESCQIIFPKNVCKYLNTGNDYSITCYIYELGTCQTKSKEIRKKYEFRHIVKISCNEVNIQRGLLDKIEERLKILSNNGWQASSILTYADKRKYEREKSTQKLTIQARINNLTTQKLLYFKEFNDLKGIQQILIKIFKTEFVKSITYGKKLDFRPSMTFVQNRNYKSAYLIYKEIIQSVGVDSRALELYTELENFSIRELPAIYELWCLVSIIQVLEGFFRFKVQQEDIILLLRSIIPSQKKLENYIRIGFVGDMAGRSVVLHYQKKYKLTHKRPDIILEIKCLKRRIFIVIDAKFKNYGTTTVASLDTLNMVDKYKGNDNDRFIFTIHPRFNSDNGLSLTNLGGESIYRDKLAKIPFHKYGYIAAQPGKTDHLRKMISMAFEYLIETNLSAQKEAAIDPEPEFEFVCINCGNSDFIKDKLSSPLGAPKFHYIFRCKTEECKHIVTIHYCWNCKTKLFKHGRFWDYHRTSIWSSMDIHCPCCGLTTADLRNMENDY